MKAEQGEAGQIMIEYNVHVPPGFLVTALALFSFLFLVYIVIYVATEAGKGQFFLLDIPPVTGRTREFFMPTFQREAGIVLMIEAAAFPVLFRVAGLAFFTIAAVV